MRIQCFSIVEGRLQARPAVDGWPAAIAQWGPSWLDVADAGADELAGFLAPLALHPVQLARILDSASDPGVLTFCHTLLMEYPAAFESDAPEPGYISILMQGDVLVTVRHGPMEALDALEAGLVSAEGPEVRHLPQIIYQILDQFADLNVQAQVSMRDGIMRTARALAEAPQSVSSADLARTRWHVARLVSLIENQLYCVTALNASEHEALQEPHRKAYIQDLVSEAEIAQRGVYRLEARVSDLYADYQTVGNDRVEKRLRLLTIVSAIALPLGLITGLLGMNVGGVPGITFRFGFAVVSALMLLIALALYWYFRRTGWFD